MTYPTPRFWPADADPVPFAELRVGDTLVLGTCWWQPPPGYTTAPVTRIQTSLLDCRPGRLPAMCGYLTDTDQQTALLTRRDRARVEADITADGGTPTIGVRIWYQPDPDFGWHTFLDAPAAATAVRAPAPVAVLTPSHAA